MNISLHYYILLNVLVSLTGVPCWSAAWGANELPTYEELDAYISDDSSKDSSSEASENEDEQSTRSTEVQKKTPSKKIKAVKHNSHNDALLSAVEENDMNGVIRALENGADVNKVTKDKYNIKRTPLHKAVGNRNEKMVALLLEKGADSNNAARRYGQTPLMYIVESLIINDNEIKIATQLLNAKADVNATDIAGCSALTVIAHKNYKTFCAGEKKLMTLLIKAKANVTTELAKAVDCDDIWAAKFLYRAGGAKISGLTEEQKDRLDDWGIIKNQGKCNIS